MQSICYKIENKMEQMKKKKTKAYHEGGIKLKKEQHTFKWVNKFKNIVAYIKDL